KGTEYHLVYAIWLLLRGTGGRVAFYKGNDLLARPAAPPITRGVDDGLPPIPLHVSLQGQDQWIQLKATAELWTRTNLLSENLLLNYVLNALHSEQEGRGWEVQLITQGVVRRGE